MAERLWQVTINERWTTTCTARTALDALSIVGDAWRNDVSGGGDTTPSNDLSTPAHSTIRDIHVRLVTADITKSGLAGVAAQFQPAPAAVNPYR